MGPSCRVVSPSGGSTLMTSAPEVAELLGGPRAEHHGRAVHDRTPESGPDMGAPAGLGAAGDVERLAAHEVAVGLQKR
jgi:hypothetical protein